jgi:TRAP-type mannitol/chloroaromatic compound transport system substrate-binding protein
VKRREFLFGLGLGAAGAAGVSALAARRQEASVSYPGKPTGGAARFDWRMVMSWPLHFPGQGEAMDLFAQEVAKMSEGRMSIKVYGAGELVGGLDVFDAVSQGTVEMSQSASYYWAGKLPASQFFCAVPFGMIAQEQNGWFYNGDGLNLWREIYARHDLMVFPAGNTGTQMGGWFRKEIRSVDDYKGLKMRIPGLGGKVVAAVGGTVVLLAATEIFPALERGVIDATEWVGPYHDRRLGLHQAAKFYYYPGWHEPGTANELTVNLPAWNKLPKELQIVIDNAAYKANLWTLSELQSRNAEALEDLVKNHGVQVKRFPSDLLERLRVESREIVEQVAESDADSRRVYDSYLKYMADSRAWRNISENAYAELQMRA